MWPGAPTLGNAKGVMPQKPHPGYDPLSAQYGYSQPVTRTPDFGKHGAGLFLTSEQPRRLDDFRRAATPLIGEQYQGSLMEALSTMLTQQRTNQGQMLDQLSTLGVNPAAALGHLIPQQNQQFAEETGGARGAAQAGQAGAEMDLMAMLTNALGQVESFYDVLQLENSLASKGRSAARHAGDQASMTALGGAALGAGGMMMGGPGGYFSS